MKLFVHGNPETSAVWSPLLGELAAHGIDDVVLLSPPGFGAPIPPGFGCTRLEYRDWLIGEIEAVGEPVDLVGHDWGAGHVYGVLAERPDLLRTWATDCAGLLHEDYEWHVAAQVWQRPGDGERALERLMSDPSAVGRSAPAELAAGLAAGIDAPMTTAILALYRSAVQPAMRQLGELVVSAARPPGLVFEPDGDPFVPAVLSEAVAARLDARVVALPGCGHWWMWQAADRAAAALVDFWNAG